MKVNREREAQISAEYAREALRYEEDTGLLYWRVRPREHFNDTPRMKQFNTRFSGKLAGGMYEGNKGYKTVHILGTKVYQSRLIWLIKTGNWPIEEIDHKDRVRSNNMWSNLREATRVQNVKNRSPFVRRMKSGTSGIPGVRWSEGRQRWQAARIHGQTDGAPRKQLGTFLSKREASEAVNLDLELRNLDELIGD
ncbi:MAG: HNH endonuclease [Gammaproteobacteria bacterium]|nr:HNH endonuclease [Gammaproteobacteria bacterium]